ncbi:hypothetical protein PHK61_22410 [Actinomycetospora lutea]|uniref:hypothetical protein n=1 Tax=Actinomycetospora lutea TaxID=663604 RepID=UPI002365E203|nr:hypothetical protein [Actinomycetospora lutea]MDD7941175.1 hypothetical protein [Actinomycetospora lutea]
MDRPRRSAAPWLYGLAGLLALLSPVIFLAVWVAAGDLEGLGVALLAAVADLVAAVVAAVVATVIAVRRGVTRVRTVVHGHPQGRVGRLAEHDAARWHLARDRFATLQAEYAAFEADKYAVAARPALADVTVPATARFVQAMGDAEFLATDEEPSGPRRAEFAAAVDRAASAWEDAQRVAEGLAQSRRGQSPQAQPQRAQSPRAESPRPQAPLASETRAVDPAPPRVNPPGSEYTQAAEAVRRAAVRGARDLRDRLRA